MRRHFSRENDYGTAFGSVPSEAAIARTKLMPLVYKWMFYGLAFTGLIAFIVGQTSWAMTMAKSSPIIFGLIIMEFILIIALSARIEKLHPATALTMFLIYSGLNGITLSVIFLVYTKASIAGTFFITASMFGAMSIYGTVTKRDLTAIGDFAFMGLFGLIIGGIVNIFLRSPMLHWVTTAGGVIVFVILTAYDTQKIREHSRYAYDDDDVRRIAVLGALELYLDFVNLFLYLLRIFGGPKTKD